MPIRDKYCELTGKENKFWKEEDIFPYEIDVSKLESASETPPDEGMKSCYKYYFGMWYRKYPLHIINERANLISAREDTGIHFNTNEEYSNWLWKESSKPIYYKCQVCDFETLKLDSLTRHSGTNSCRIRKLKMEARKNQTVYIPPNRRKHYCDVCCKSFTNRHVWVRHLNSDKHKDKSNVDPLPTKCLVCGIDFSTKLKTRRHLKAAKKCHRKALENILLLENWYYMVDRFQCKFDKEIIYNSKKCKPCPTKKVIETPPKKVITTSKVLVV